MFHIFFRCRGPIADECRDDLSFGVHQENRGIALDFVFLAEFGVLRLEFIGQFLFVGEIEFDQHELLGDFVLERHPFRRLRP